MSLTGRLLRELVEYSPETGIFTWRNPPRRKDWVGRPAGSNTDRYIRIKGYQAHHLAWLYVYGEWPKKQIDHINGNGRDNRIVNLRLATQAENACNRKIGRNNSTGFKGVSRKRSRFAAYVWKNGVRRCLGCFDTPEQAHAAYCIAARELHGAFAHMGG